MRVKLKLLFTSSFILNSIVLLGCSCSQLLLSDNIANSDFIATVNILKIEPDSTDDDYHWAQVEIIDLYKGEHLKEISINSVMTSSCAFLPEEKSTWLIYARVFKDRLSFGFCSGSKILNLKQWKDQPKVYQNSRNVIERELAFLNFIREKNIRIENEYDLRIVPTMEQREQWKGYDGNVNEFSILQFTVHPDLTIKEMKILKAFENTALRKRIENSMSQIKKTYRYKENPIPQEVKLIVGLFYYAGDRHGQSFVSVHDW